MNTTPQARRAVYGRLLRSYAELPAHREHDEARWTVLMAAHVVGQADLGLHVDSHLRMLRLAWDQGDPREAAGQLLRLALVPLGHALGRLPAGNIGRATVPALRPMVPPPAVQALIARHAGSS
ncbi:DUF3703 domain-containing protein [Caenimonas sedimenti]|uniref:DUF3703 domain-containing protein n=1 Tax=Caenimonas sedimenti TaxID=2596921 RepID=A0A562ZG44_9BURK|nr:DUF3703 domain-containing protein [Caenimonas sedimenti]TWO66681.1 DUF3703 domain-containing protein [Caenimonas sedimenti]